MAAVASPAVVLAGRTSRRAGTGCEGRMGLGFSLEQARDPKQWTILVGSSERGHMPHSGSSSVRKFHRKGAARDRSGLQPLQLRERDRTCGNHRQIPRRSTDQCPRRRGSRLPGSARTDQVN